MVHLAVMPVPAVDEAVNVRAARVYAGLLARTKNLTKVAIAVAPRQLSPRKIWP